VLLCGVCFCTGQIIGWDEHRIANPAKRACRYWGEASNVELDQTRWSWNIAVLAMLMTVQAGRENFAKRYWILSWAPGRCKIDVLPASKSIRSCPRFESIKMQVSSSFPRIPLWSLIGVNDILLFHPNHKQNVLHPMSLYSVRHHIRRHWKSSERMTSQWDGTIAIGGSKVPKVNLWRESSEIMEGLFQLAK
jgi:hypothetical protein